MRPPSRSERHGAAAKVAAAVPFVFAVLFAGCATWTFDPVRSARFVDEQAAYVEVDYGKEKHSSTFVTPNGVRLPFNTNLKVRVGLPDGTRFVAYQVMSPAGVLYKTDDGEWEYFEEGTSCLVAQYDDKADDGSYTVRFHGVLCANLQEPREARKK